MKCPECYATGMALLPNGELFPCVCQKEEIRKIFAETSDAIKRLSLLESKVKSKKILILIYRSKAKLFLQRAELTEEIRHNRKVLV